MKKPILFAAVASALTSMAPAFAETFTDSAPVVSVRAISEPIPVNREECWSEQRRGYDRMKTKADHGARFDVTVGAEIRVSAFNQLNVTAADFSPAIYSA